MCCVSWIWRNEICWPVGIADGCAVPWVYGSPATWMEQPMKESDQPIRLDVSKRERAAALLARAFQDDPLFRAVLPDEGKRRKMSLWLHDKVLRYCCLYGTTHTLPSLEGAACWLRPGQTELTIGRIMRSGLLAMPLRMGPAAFVPSAPTWIIRASCAGRNRLTPTGTCGHSVSICHTRAKGSAEG